MMFALRKASGYLTERKENETEDIKASDYKYDSSTKKCEARKYEDPRSFP
jgi:hypothetical protein